MSPKRSVKVSIVIPCYNHGHYLKEALASALRSDFDSFEVVVVDDGSTDESTLSIIEELKGKLRDSQNVIFLRQENLGLAAARNNGIKEARGEYILPLDSDNRIRSQYLRKAAEVLDNNPSIGVVYAYAKFIGERDGFWEFPVFDARGLLVGNFVEACSVLRKSVWEDCNGYDPDMGIMGFEDWDLWIGAMERGWKFNLIREVLFDYRVVPGSMISGCNVPENRRHLIKYICNKHRDTYIKNLGYVIAEKDVSVLEWSNRASDLDGALQQKDTHIGNLEAVVKHKDTHIGNLDAAIRDKDVHIVNLESAIIAKDADIVNLESAIIAKDADIVNLEAAIRDKDADIVNLEAAIRDKDAHIVNLENVISAKDAHIVNLENVIRDKDVHISNLAASLGEKDAYIQFIHSGHGWRLLNKYFRMRDALLPSGTRRRAIVRSFFRLPALLGGSDLPPGSKKTSFSEKIDGSVEKQGLSTAIACSPEEMPAVQNAILTDYELWIKKNEPDEEALKLQIEDAKYLSYWPLISIIVPVFNTDGDILIKMIESVEAQTYTNWQLCIADGNSERPYIREILEDLAMRESRIKVGFLSENKGIAGNSNEALSLATGDYIALLDHDDELSPNALYEVVSLVNEKSETDFIYTDEDKISEDGKKRFDPHFKPDWSSDTLRSYNYITHLSVFKKKLIEGIGGFRAGFDGSQDYDLILRASEKANHVEHIPKILYHWRISANSAAGNENAKPYAYKAAKKALREHLERVGLWGDVQDGNFTGSYRTRYRIEGSPLVSIIIPTRDKVELLRTCLESIARLTSYQSYEIIVIDNCSENVETFSYYDSLRESGRVRLLQYSEPFNFAAINNYAVKTSKGDYLLFLNNDTEIITPDWIESMLGFAQRRDVGIVGASLYYPDNTIQHAGVIIGLGGIAGHVFTKFPRNSFGTLGRAKVIQNLSAVTAACMMMRRAVFDEVGGLDEGYSHAFNDVDLCMKVRAKGYLIVFTPFVELYHHESKTRGSDDTAEKQERFRSEVELFRQKWGDILKKGDPYYNSNLTLDREDFSIRI